MKRRLLLGLAAVAMGFGSATAQQGAARPFEIADNSFLVEEAFNQEKGVFQNIFLFKHLRDGAGWGLEFTQEWPVGGQRHQFSYTVPVEDDFGAFGNVQLNWRLQLRMEDANGPAVSPRLSAILPTGSDDSFDYGAQFNLPVSRQFGDLYVHANAGLTWARTARPALIGEEKFNLLSPHVAGSVIWRALPLVHPMVESVMSFEEQLAPACCETSRARTWIVSPGARAAMNFGDHQLVLGAAVPLTISKSELAPDFEAKVLVYVSYELPFQKQ